MLTTMTYRFPYSLLQQLQNDPDAFTCMVVALQIQSKFGNNDTILHVLQSTVDSIGAFVSSAETPLPTCSCI